MSDFIEQKSAHLKQSPLRINKDHFGVKKVPLDDENGTFSDKGLFRRQKYPFLHTLSDQTSPLGDFGKCNWGGSSQDMLASHFTRLWAGSP